MIIDGWPRFVIRAACAMRSTRPSRFTTIAFECTTLFDETRVWLLMSKLMILQLRQLPSISAYEERVTV